MAGTWTTVTIGNAPSGFSADTMLLLTDGSVMIHGTSSSSWVRLSPGTDPTQQNGIYANGTFATTQAMSTNREYFATGITTDGRMYVIGGEDSGNPITQTAAHDGETFDPQTGAWTAIHKPSPQFDLVEADAMSVVLPDGRVLLGGDGGNQAPPGSQATIWDPTDDSWVLAGTEFGAVPNTKQGAIDEETWTLLPNGNVLTVNITTADTAEQYIPSSDKWVSAGTTKQGLAITTFGNPPVNVGEMGPALVLPSGKLLAIGASGATGIYTSNADATKAGTWVKGPSLGVDGSNNAITAIDAPAVLTPGGRVICAGGSTVPTTNSSGQINDYFSKPSTFFEWDPTTSVTTMPQLTNQPPATSQYTYQVRFLVLPTGQIAMSANDGNLYIYTPDSTEGSPETSWAPVITGFPSAMIVGHSYQIAGQRLNGISCGASYGDDAQMVTNWPIVQLTEQATGAVRYARSYAFSTMGIAAAGDTTTASCEIDVPSDLDEGAYQMVVIANGIASAPETVQIGTRDCYITLERDTYSKGDVDGMIKQAHGGRAVYNPALYVVVEGFKPSELGITSAAHLASPSVQPGVTVPTETSITASFAGPVLAEDTSLPDAPQRFTYPFKLSFDDDSAFGFAGPELAVPVIAQLNAVGSAVSGVGVVELLQSADPIILHGDQVAGYPWYLSVDIRVLQLNAGDGKFGTNVPTSGSASSAATTFIQKAIDNLNGKGVTAAVETAARNDFNGVPQLEDLSELTLAPDDGNGHNYYNFALARVRLVDTVLDAKNVALFFRLWPAQQTNAAYDQSTTYRRGTNPQGETIPLLGVNGDEIVSIPFFAEPRVTSSQSLTTQRDTHNRHAVIAHDPSGAEVDTYFGCWLDINQPNDLHFPQRVLGVNPDGPFNTVSPLFPIQQLVRSNHCCVIAEIEIDGQPQLISSSADPSSSDKLAQRNVTFVGIPNPGVLDSRRAPQTFEIKPSVSVLPFEPGFDELMIDFGTVPPGTTAEVFLPATSADEILKLASERYLTHRLMKVDQYTIGMPTDGLGWLPIPTHPGGNLAGLLTLDFPATVRKGTVHTIVVRQVSTVDGSDPRADDGSPVAEVAVHTGRQWRRVIGSFALVVPVSTKAELLPGEERKLSIMRWIGDAIPHESRWWPVFLRYLDQLTLKVGALGGDPSTIPATGTGSWPGLIGGHGSGHGHGSGGSSHDHHRRHAGKVVALGYDRFGDFDGFTIETFEGHHRRFCSREGRVGRLARRAWLDRLVVVVFTDGDDDRVAGLDLFGSTIGPDC
jgi:Kelch motif